MSSMRATEISDRSAPGRPGVKGSHRRGPARSARLPRRRRREAPRFGQDPLSQARLQRQRTEFADREKEAGGGGSNRKIGRGGKKESAGKQSSLEDPAYNTWAGRQEQSKAAASGQKCSGRFRREGARGRPRSARDARRRCAQGALSGAAYLRRGRRRALPGAALGVRRAEPGHPEPIAEGRKRQSRARDLGRH